MCLYTECRCHVEPPVDPVTAIVIVIHGGPATGKTYNQDTFAKHYGMKVGGEVDYQSKRQRFKSGFLYTSIRPVQSDDSYIRNITIARAFKDAGIEPFKPTEEPE